ncbi:PIN domain-containing protein [Nitriliruptor alkaliphilus]|uniref:PIN domain-containing protein n=1 Tax=Nitriliruptor alkaliphilus TaxID=427918 RepID=UPI000695D74B|nr:PIN domain-containing protein [Nitriliruptor alkaliphilus]
MIDTSVMLAGLVHEHEFHEVARPQVREAARRQVPGIVIAETWAALRRAPWHLDAATVQEVLAPWAIEDRILVTPAGAYVDAVRTGRAANLGGNIHDLLIAMTCAEHGLPLATLDRRQATLGRSVPGLDVTLLLPDA